MSDDYPVLLFSYGTLQDKSVQLANSVALASGLNAWVYVQA